ncbi:Protein FAM26D [Microtus ochrogaster]|uniref:RWD domain-containing protein 1 n=1 Tax=Microtus ochrogaster TaxID=79684 RepID=A0A8J6GDV4_MICOH|nr:Protein FAM26D [Microtus ochrogaster]
MWTVASEYCCCSCTPPYRRSSPLERRLACLMFFNITGRALVAPLTWLTVTLMTGTYYECAASEYASVDQYPMFANVTASKREEILAGFPCYTSAPSDVMPVRDEVALLHRYQSQHHYWSNHLQSERALFEQAAEEHSRLLIRHRIKKVFGFIPGSEDIKHIRIPSCQDWRDISIPNILCVGDTTQGPYSFLGERVVEENEEDRQEAGGRRVRCSVPPGCRADARAAARATMTDYGEEQRNELEALESIYPDSFTVLSESPPSFTITVTSEAGENDETVQTTLKFTYSEKYPDEAPLYEIFSQENLEDNDVSDILKLLALQKLFHGTPVTIENFLSWKAKFDAELLEIKKKRMKEEEQAGKNKLSGKQLFETDHNLDTSDIQFLEDAGNNVEVDESLFQEMDDLELEDGDDDPDYNPVAAGSDSSD